MERSIIKVGKSVFIKSIHNATFTGTIKSVGRKYFIVDLGEEYEPCKFEIGTLKDATGFGRRIYQSENHYNKFLAEQKRMKELNQKMVLAFETRNNVSENNMIKIIKLLSE